MSTSTTTTTTATGNSGTHRAALNAEKAAPLSVSSRPTPNPGPGQVLISVRAVGLNIVDTIMRDMGFMITEYPCVLGSDVAGTILATGTSGVPESFKPGTKVAAFASAFFQHGKPDYGAFQEVVLVSVGGVTLMPETMGWAEAATLPMVVFVALAAWEMLGLDYTYSPAKGSDENKNANKAILIWGAGTGIGTMAVQTAKLMGYTVIATASPGNHDYLKGLGADVVFDYRDAAAAERDILQYVRGRNLAMKNCFFGYGELAPCQNILKELNGENGGAKIAHGPPIPESAKKVDGVDVSFISPSSDEVVREKQFAQWMSVYLRDKLASGEIQPSPEVKIVGKGLESIDSALTELREKGVKCAKPVVVFE
ncbi:chaperonin 10-like protein [Microdochium bolleyi]|uniref:Chaperonin 10-like protein n=1 Tax=Microdochium bolleyi TaxID=196109 RepID=A0A136IT45_9PEZI|nr:chaperonin 10-like protein [Microdochium bolleyi]